jgi:hypothetical protein
VTLWEETMSLRAAAAIGTGTKSAENGHGCQRRSRSVGDNAA